MAHDDTSGDRLAEVEVVTLSKTETELEAKKLLDTLGGRLPEMEVDTTH